MLRPSNYGINNTNIKTGKKAGLLRRFLPIIILIILIILFIKKNSKIKTSKTLLLEMKDKFSEKQKTSSSSSSEISSLKSKISELKEKSKSLKESLGKVKEEQNKIKSKANDKDSINDKEIKEKEEKLTKVKKNYDELNTKTKSIKDEIEKSNTDKKDSEEKLKQLNIECDEYLKTSKLVDSYILSDDDVKTILDFFDSDNINFNLLYRSSRDGASQKNFENFEHKNLFIVGKATEGFLVGGYTTKNFIGEGYKEDQYAFLINITNKKRYYIKDTKHALYLKKNEFPTFGEEDLVIAPGKVKSKFPKSYKGKNNLELTDGKSEINFEEVEIFYLSMKK